MTAEGSSDSVLDTSVQAIPSTPDGPEASLVAMQLTLGPRDLRYSRRVDGRGIPSGPKESASPRVAPGAASASKRAHLQRQQQRAGSHDRALPAEPKGEPRMSAGSGRVKGLSLALAAVLGMLVFLPAGALCAPLPEGRAYEQVSPADKNGGDVGGPLLEGAFANALGHSASDANSILYASFSSFADAQSAELFTYYISTRGDGGWSTHAISPPPADPPRLFENPPFHAFARISRPPCSNGGSRRWRRRRRLNSRTSTWARLGITLLSTKPRR